MRNNVASNLRTFKPRKRYRFSFTMFLRGLGSLLIMWVLITGLVFLAAEQWDNSPIARYQQERGASYVDNK